MVVDDLGRAYVGSQAFEGGVIVRIDPDDTVTVVAEELEFPNGMVITADRSTLIVAESVGRRLTAFTIGADGKLSDRRHFRRRARRTARRHHARRRRRGLGRR